MLLAVRIVLDLEVVVMPPCTLDDSSQDGHKTQLSLTWPSSEPNWGVIFNSAKDTQFWRSTIVNDELDDVSFDCQGLFRAQAPAKKVHIYHGSEHAASLLDSTIDDITDEVTIQLRNDETLQELISRDKTVNEKDVSIILEYSDSLYVHVSTIDITVISCSESMSIETSVAPLIYSEDHDDPNLTTVVLSNQLAESYHSVEDIINSEYEIRKVQFRFQASQDSGNLNA